LGWLALGCGRIGYDSLTIDPENGRLAEPVDGGSGGIGIRDAESVDGASSASGGFAGTGGFAGVGGAGGSGAGGSGGSGGSSGDSGVVVATGGVPVGTGGSPGRDAGTVVTDGGVTVVTVDVTDPSQTVRVGTAAVGSGELDLTPPVKNSAGAAYLPAPFAVSAATSFAVHFSFRNHDPIGQSGDGFAFLWQNDPRGASAIGAAGSALGYDVITPSVVVEFDTFGNTFDPGGNDVGIMLNGDSRTPIAHAFPSFDFSDGSVYYAWIDYLAASHTLAVYLSPADVRPATALVSATVDLYGILGGSAYLGFTAGTGVSTQYHAILSLSVEYWP
jgi:legume-like lectin family protein